MTAPRAWALDLDGVMWTGRVPIDGSADAVTRLLDAGHEVVFVTNNSFATRAEQEDKLASFGVDAAGRVLSSAMAGAAQCAPGEQIYVLGGPGIVEAVTERGATVVDRYVEDDAVPDAVLVGLDWHLSYERLRGAVQAVLAGARFVATNRDAVYPTEHGFYPGAGALVAAVAAATDVEPTVAGKPERGLATLVVERFGSDGIMVGDRPDTDGLFAGNCGYEFGLVLSGVTAEADLPVTPAPSRIAPDLRSLVDAALR